MRSRKFALATALVGFILLGGVLLAIRHQANPSPKRIFTGLPIGDLARGRIEPSIGLGAPFPAWAPLPEKGLVTGAETAAPRPPWGASAVAMVKIDEDVEPYMADYRQRLAAKGFRVRRLPAQPGLIVDRPQAQFQSDDRDGHVIYITFRGDSAVRFVQLTYWSPPAPRLLP